jgi:hypothetical protein
MNIIDPFSFERSKCVKNSIRIVDGDTFHCNVILSYLPDNYSLKSTIRLYRIDSAEKNTESGKLMIKLLNHIISNSDEIFIQGIKKDIYGRVLSEVYIVKDNIEYNLSNYLIDNKVVVKADKRYTRNSCEKLDELPEVNEHVEALLAAN